MRSIALCAALLASPAIAGDDSLLAQVPPGRVQSLSRPDASERDLFGVCVDLDAGRLVVGARGADELAGAVYVYTRIDGVWTLEQRLRASDGAPGAGFGVGVSVCGDWLIVGAAFANAAGFESGKAYAFEHTGSGWVERQILTSLDLAPGDWFGVSCDLDGDTAVIGARHDADGLAKSGSAFVFERGQDNVWVQTAKLRPTPHKAFANFAHAVAINSGRVLAGSIFGNGAAFEDGCAYIFERDGDEWTQTARLFRPDGVFEDYLGIDVALSGDTAVVGGRRDDDLGPDTGSATVFEKGEEGWTIGATLLPISRAPGEQFGNKVALDGEVALIGSWGADPAGVTGGACDLFRRRADGSWMPVARFTPATPTEYGSFGHDVDVRADQLLLGAYEDDTFADKAGYAWVADMSGLIGEPCGAGDMALPLGTLDFEDVLAFVVAFARGDPPADLDDPPGVFDISDVLAFLDAFGAGCP